MKENKFFDKLRKGKTKDSIWGRNQEVSEGHLEG